MNKLKIEITGTPADYEYPLCTVYTAEFDYDFRLLVCHSHNESVLESFNSLIEKRQVDNFIKQAIDNSSTVTLNIIYIQRPSDIKGLTSVGAYNALLTIKFDFIHSLKTYAPFGYNNLNYIIEYGLYKERALARKLIKELRLENPQARKKPSPRPENIIYRYDARTHEYIDSFESVPNACEITGISAASIYQCLYGRTKTAGGYIWSRNRADRIESSATENRIKRLNDKIITYKIAMQQRDKITQL